MESVRYDHLLKQVNLHNSPIFKNDVVKLDWQDDGAAYRTFCSSNLKPLVTHDYQQEGFVCLFIYYGYVFNIYN